MYSPPLVKICGLTNLEDTLAAIEFGADWLGFNFYPESPRFLDPDDAFAIFQEIPYNIQKVGLFVNAEINWIHDITLSFNLDRIQFHGDETAETCNSFGRPWYKAFRLKDEEVLKTIPQYESDWILADASVEGVYGGTGVKADWGLAKQAKQFGKKLMLAGGLNANNIQQAIAIVQPDAVDVSSGIESQPGKKDLAKMEAFVAKAQSTTLRIVG